MENALHGNIQQQESAAVCINDQRQYYPYKSRRYGVKQNYTSYREGKRKVYNQNFRVTIENAFAKEQVFEVKQQ